MCGGVVAYVYGREGGPCKVQVGMSGVAGQWGEVHGRIHGCVVECFSQRGGGWEGLGYTYLCSQHDRQVSVAGAVYGLGLQSVFGVLLSQTLVHGQLAVFRLGGP